MKAFVHRGPDEVRSPPTGTEESPQAPIRAASSPEGGQAVSMQTRLWASEALKASLCAFQRPPCFSPRQAHRSRQRGLRGWSPPGAGCGGSAGVPGLPLGHGGLGWRSCGAQDGPGGGHRPQVSEMEVGVENEVRCCFCAWTWAVGTLREGSGSAGQSLLPFPGPPSSPTGRGRGAWRGPEEAAGAQRRPRSSSHCALCRNSNG